MTVHRQGAPGVVLSPHLDDAVLSAWSTLRAPGEVVVVNVCTAVPEAGVVGRIDRRKGATDSAAFMRLRLAEDVRALALAGRTSVPLGFLDDQFREGPIPPDQLRNVLEGAVPEASWLCAPAALGGQSDHVAVRDVALSLARDASIPTWLYADLPYATRVGWPHWVTGGDPRRHLVPDAAWEESLASASSAGEDLVPEVSGLGDEEAARKLEALAVYETQFQALDAGPIGRLRNPEVIGFEVRWLVRGR